MGKCICHAGLTTKVQSCIYTSSYVKLQSPQIHMSKQLPLSFRTQGTRTFSLFRPTAHIMLSVTDLPPSPSVCLLMGLLLGPEGLFSLFREVGPGLLALGRHLDFLVEWLGALRAYLYWSDLHPAILWRMPERSSLRELLWGWAPALGSI